jgi:hypothetical protein
MSIEIFKITVKRNKSLEIESESAFAIACRGAVHRALGNYKQAIFDLERALRFQPVCGYTLVELGKTYRD